MAIRDATSDDGRSAGSGKSTLAQCLAGDGVELVPEEAIFHALEFAEVGRAFTTKQWPTPELMLAAYRRLFARDADAFVFDWNVVAMIEDLPASQPDGGGPTSDDPSAMPDPAVLARHARQVREESGGDATLLKRCGAGRETDATFRWRLTPPGLRSPPQGGMSRRSDARTKVRRSN